MNGVWYNENIKDSNFNDYTNQSSSSTILDSAWCTVSPLSHPIKQKEKMFVTCGSLQLSVGQSSMKLSMKRAVDE